MFSICNDGPRILETNYFSSDLAQRGLAFLTINANTFRLLTPDSMQSHVDEMLGAREVIITRGLWSPKAGVDVDAYELLFEDDSDTPMAVYIMVEQSDRLLGAKDRTGNTLLRFDLIMAPCRVVLSLPARFRTADRLPCLQAWG